MATIESTLLALLLFETLMHRITRHIVSELPMAGDVVADCVRLLVRLYVVILIAEALMVRVLGAFTVDEWLAHDRGAKIAGAYEASTAAPEATRVQLTSPQRRAKLDRIGEILRAAKARGAVQ